MNKHTASEVAYKHGYDFGLKAKQEAYYRSSIKRTSAHRSPHNEQLWVLHTP